MTESLNGYCVSPPGHAVVLRQELLQEVPVESSVVRVLQHDAAEALRPRLLRHTGAPRGALRAAPVAPPEAPADHQRRLQQLQALGDEVLGLNQAQAGLGRGRYISI